MEGAPKQDEKEKMRPIVDVSIGRYNDLSGYLRATNGRIGGCVDDGGAGDGSWVSYASGGGRQSAMVVTFY